MIRQLKSDRMMRDYLLGLLSENEQEQTEKRLMTESGYADELEMAEQELVDEYAAGLLAGREKESFERLFLSHPDRRQNVAFAQALRRFVASRSTGERASWTQTRWQLLAMAAAVIVIIAGSLLSYRVLELGRQVADLRAGRSEVFDHQQQLEQRLRAETARRTALEQELAALESAGKSPGASLSNTHPFIAITLLPGLVRSQGGIPKVILTPGKDVQLRLVVEDGEYPQYSASLRSAEGSEIWRQDGLRHAATSDGTAVTARLSFALLKPQDYVLRLTGKKPDGSFESVGSYYFRIAAR